MNAWLSSHPPSNASHTRSPLPGTVASMEALGHGPECRDGAGAQGDTPGMPGVVGIRIPAESARWLMGVQVCDAPHGYDNTVRAYAAQAHIIEWHLAPAKVQRLLPSGQVLETLPSSGFIVRPAQTRLGLVASGPARFAHFCTSDTFVRTVAVDWLGDAADRADLLGIERVMRSDASIQPMLDLYLQRALDQAEPPTRLEMDSRAHLVVLQLLKRHSVLAQKGRRARSGGLAPYQLQRACELMTRDLAEEVPLSELAAAVGLSYHHFCHAFKASVGVAPHQWLVERRVEKACELLRNTRESVTEIAASVGYDDPNQLLRVFRARRSTTPAAYRRELQGRSPS